MTVHDNLSLPEMQAFSTQQPSRAGKAKDPASSRLLMKSWPFLATQLLLLRLLLCFFLSVCHQLAKLTFHLYLCNSSHACAGCCVHG